MNIAIISGELSGDLLGAALSQEIRNLVPDADLWGMGSSAMREAGVELLADSAGWGAISISEAVRKVPYLMATVAPRIRRELRARRPDVVVLIDFGAFNVRVARYSKSLGLKVLYYFPPGAWRRHGTRESELARITDCVATPFIWNAERLRSLRVRAEYVGHPLLERARPRMTREEFAAQFGMDPSRPIVGILPGSRRAEVVHLMPVLLDAIRLIYREVMDAQFVIGVAPTISSDLMVSYLNGHSELLSRLGEIWHEFAQEAETKILKPVTRTASRLSQHAGPTLVTVGGVLIPPESLQRELEARRHSEHLRARAEHALPPTVLAKGLTYDVMAHSDVLVACSGTATLEAAVLGTPMVIVYRGSGIMAAEYRLRGLHKKIRFIGLPNILLDRQILPELIQDEASPEAIAKHALLLMNDPVTRENARSGLREVRAQLGSEGASARTARLVVDLAESAPQ